MHGVTIKIEMKKFGYFFLYFAFGPGIGSCAKPIKAAYLWFVCSTNRSIEMLYLQITVFPS